MADRILENPHNVTSADIVVGIPSYNEADSISYPTEQASLGLTTFFKGKKAVIINCDNASTDGTRETFFSGPCEVDRMYVSTPPGVKGKGNNFRNLFKLIDELGAKAAVVVDADLKSITPKWIKSLGEPLFDDFGYVTPIYLRHKYDGTITNNIAYPLTRCLYGRRVRQPIGGDFGFSGELARYYLEHETWNEAVAHFGIDVWMTTLAMYFRKPITQAFLGRPKIHRPKDPASDLGPMFREVVGTAFRLADVFAPFWKDVKLSRPTAIYGFGLGETEMPPPVGVDKEALFGKFQEGVTTYEQLWRRTLTPETFTKLSEVVELGEDHFELPTALWAHVLFDFAAAVKERGEQADELLDGLSPLYFGRTLSFVRSTEGMAMQQAEEYIEEQCQVFEDAKPYLIDRWGD